MPPADTVPARGLTITDVARRYRVKRGKVLGWIRSGQLQAINTADPLSRPRHVVMPAALEAFEQRHASTPAKPPPRRKKRTAEIDYFAD
jgi:hypothetical protein